MIPPLVLIFLFADQAAKPAPAAAPAAAVEATQQTGLEESMLLDLAKVRRIYVDILTGGESALQIRDLLMSSIQSTKLFIVTEDGEKADAVLRGAAKEEVFTDVFQSSDSINARGQISIPSLGSNNTSRRYSDRISTGIGAGESESQKIEERKHQARATVRLVNRDGDVIWSATEESLGAKFAGASVDVVDKITKRLAADFRRAKTQVLAAPPN